MMLEESAEIILRQCGLRVTPQRQGVLQLFLQQEGWHWSADQVREKLLPVMPGLARGTTYKVLDELVRKEICEELSTPDGTALYGLRLVPHHHFYCIQCHRWYDVNVEGLEGLTLIGNAPQSSIEQVDVTFRGVCRICSQEERSP